MTTYRVSKLQPVGDAATEVRKILNPAAFWEVDHNLIVDALRCVEGTPETYAYGDYEITDGDYLHWEVTDR